MIELDEKYTDVIVRRYVDFVGSSDDVFVIRDGRKIPYSEAANISANTSQN